jgi:predicted phosphodiesterase
MRLLVLSDLHLEMGAATQPGAVCGHCGSQYGRSALNPGATWSMGTCGVCAVRASVTEARDFGLLQSDWDLKLPSPDAYDVVVLAGDIQVGVQGLYWAAKTFRKPVIYLPGNHEFYGARLERMAVEMRACAKELGIHYLDNDALTLDGVRFIGSTLWTDFELFGSGMPDIGRALHAAKNYISDFSTIIYGTTGWFRPEQSVALHRVARQFLADELAQPFDGKTCVITHHLPSKRSVAERYADDVLSAAFASNVDDLVEQADVWIHGHTHDSFDYELKGCRVACNPRGYPDRKRSGYENRAFDAGKIIDIGTPAPKRRATP